MGQDIPLGKIAGIRVGMHVSVFFMATLYSFVLATYRFPATQPGMTSTSYWIAGLSGAFLLFVSLLIHELGHALVARDEGIGVHGMSLNLLGGVTRMETSPTTPGSEFRVAVVGPVASATCGVVFLVGAYLLPNDAAMGLVGDVFAWIGVVNLMLAALNALPAAPLDGGKVLSSAIWRASGNQSAAMTWSGAAGVVLGMVSVTWGIRELRSPSGREDFALSALVLGIFIGMAALQQVRSGPLFRALEGRTVREAMAAGPPSAPGWSSIAEFLRTSQPEPQHQAYPVVQADGQVSGLLTAAAIRATPPQQWEALLVSELAYPFERLTVVRADEPLLSALQKVEGGEVRHALVVADDGRIVGTLDPSALQRAMNQTPSRLQSSRV